MLYTFDVPVVGVITQGPHAEHENATDFACTVGRPIYAVTSGEGKSHYNSRMGWVYTLTSPSGKVVTSYSHLSAVVPPGWVNVETSLENAETLAHGAQVLTFTSGPTFATHSRVKVM